MGVKEKSSIYDVPSLLPVVAESPSVAVGTPDPAAAKVRMRIKGEADGPVYQGQVIVVPCFHCLRK